jgi:hypothetical protein
MQELKNKLVQFDSLVRSFEEASEKGLDDQIKIIGLKAIMPVELEHKLIYELSFGDEYKKSREWIDTLVVKHTSTAPMGSSQQFPMEIGNLGACKPGSDNAVLSVLEKLVDRIDARFDALSGKPGLAAFSGQPSGTNFAQKGAKGGKGQQDSGGKAGGKGGGCWKCGRSGHLARNCTSTAPSVPVWRQGKGANNAGQADSQGGNPNSKLICRAFAQNGKCKYGASCRFKHVYGTVGCLAGLAQHAGSLGKAMPACMLNDEHLTWDANVEGYCLGSEHEIDACCHLALEAEIMDPDDIAAMKTFFLEGDVEVPGFQGQPKRR